MSPQNKGFEDSLLFLARIGQERQYGFIEALCDRGQTLVETLAELLKHQDFPSQRARIISLMLSLVAVYEDLGEQVGFARQAGFDVLASQAQECMDRFEGDLKLARSMIGLSLFDFEEIHQANPPHR